MRRVVLATGNPGKLKEMREILAGRGLEVVAQSEFGIAPPVEDGDSFVANALGGRPGLRTARYAGPAADERANNDRLLRELASVPAERRGARYRCAMAFVRSATDPAPVIAEAAWEGRIGLERRGTGGFGYDPLFIVAGDTRTAAEMPAAEKNGVSHRGQALIALAVRMQVAGW